jgi:natural product biosynthesis luciferase-like monooxygenase protein
MEQHPSRAQRSAFWAALLEGEPAKAELRPDHRRPPVSSFLRETVSRTLDSECAARIRMLGEEYGASPWTVALSAWMLLLVRHGNASDVMVGTVLRNELSILRCEIRSGETVRQLVARVARLAHEVERYAPVDEALVTSRSIGERCGTLLIVDAGGLDGSGDIAAEQSALSDVSLIVEGDASQRLTIDFDAELYESATIERVLDHLVRLIGGMAHAPDAPIDSIAMLSDDELTTLLERWNETSCAVPDTLVHDCIEREAQRHPERIALIAGDERLSYRELEQRADRLAAHLGAHGVQPDDLIAIRLPRSADLVVAMLAALKAGGAYLAIDPAQPVVRSALMLEDAQPRVLVTRSDLDPLDFESRATVFLDRWIEPNENAASAPSARVSPSNLAYVMYTSGSTGIPKGVMVEHRNVVNFFVGMDERLQRPPAGVWLAITSVSFDISVLELLWTLARGFTVVIADAQGAVGSPPPAPVITSATTTKPMEFGLFYFGSDESRYADAPERAKYQLLLEGAQFADRHGFSAVWTPERHFHAFGGLFPSPAITSATVAALTSRIAIRAGSCVLPLNDPVRVTEEWSLIDNLSGGRVGISFASGWQPDDFVLAPDRYADRQQIMFEGIETVRHLWRGGTITRSGGRGNTVTFGTRPRPVQPELPVWVTAGGTPSTFARAGEIGAKLLTHLLGQSLEELSEKLRLYRQAWRAHGHDGEGHVTLMLHTFIGDDPAAVREIVRGPLTQYLRESVSLFTPFAATFGLDANHLSPEDSDTLAAFAFERYYGTSGLFGTPETALPFIRSLSDLGVDEVACLIDFGVPDEIVLRNLPNLARLRDLAASRANGASVAPAPSRQPISQLIGELGVTHVQCTPTLARLLLSDDATADSLGSLQQMLVGGEELPAELGRALLERLAPGALLNMYGPTETTVWSTCHRVTRDEEPVPIGRPIANTRLYVLDEKRHPVPIGAPGELYIGGAGVTRGYWRRPELTHERFPRDPFVSGDDSRMYRTGDLVRYRGDGALEFIGRADRQLKIRGNRVELGEIEAVLRQYPQLSDVVVVPQRDGPMGSSLAAYVVPRVGATVNLNALRAYAHQALLDAMVPSSWTILEALPTTTSGKLDRNALPEPDFDGAAHTPASEAPRTPTERRIQALWVESLHVAEIDIHANFFDLGGNSLIAIHLLNRLREHYRAPLSMADIFRHSTIEALARHVDGLQGSNAGDRIIPAARRRPMST